jgi:hypothetical protein
MQLHWRVADAASYTICEEEDTYEEEEEEEDTAALPSR